MTPDRLNEWADRLEMAYQSGILQPCLDVAEEIRAAARALADEEDMDRLDRLTAPTKAKAGATK